MTYLGEGGHHVHIDAGGDDQDAKKKSMWNQLLRAMREM